MNNPVKVNCDAIEAIGYKNELLKAGLQIEQDFVWYWQQCKYDGFTMPEPSYAGFEFKDPKLASFYRLKWTQ